MQTDITFLHTAQVHVQTFEQLVMRNNPDLKTRHIVESDLLENAITNGITPELESKIKALLVTHSQTSQLVVCSCSTLGGIAERTELTDGNFAIRIDRAMADLAVESGKNILVLAALESTLAPTATLMLSSQAKIYCKNRIDYCVVDNSWDFFLNGNTKQYLQRIADVIEEKQESYDCIVLAQASMAGAIKLIAEKRALILSSPEIGVKSLLKKLVKQTI